MAGDALRRARRGAVARVKSFRFFVRLKLGHGKFGRNKEKEPNSATQSSMWPTDVAMARIPSGAFHARHRVWLRLETIWSALSPEIATMARSCCDVLAFSQGRAATFNVERVARRTARVAVKGFPSHGYCGGDHGCEGGKAVHVLKLAI